MDSEIDGGNGAQMKDVYIGLNSKDIIVINKENIKCDSNSERPTPTNQRRIAMDKKEKNCSTCHYFFNIPCKHCDKCSHSTEYSAWEPMTKKDEKDRENYEAEINFAKQIKRLTKI